MLIALLTDFGAQDSYAGVLKGVIARITPETKVIDLTHEVPPYDVSQGALILYQACRYFPKETIFVAVVDPGVGSFRRPILVKTQNYYFVGPDNGLFSRVLSDEKAEKIYLLHNRDYFLKDPSSTFHGRDLFAPVSAHLSRGVPPHEFGCELSDYEKLKDLSPTIDKKGILGKIISLDRFGNAITNISLSLLQQHTPNLKFTIQIGKKTLKELKTHYAEGAPKKPFFLFGGSNLLEIAVNQGSAAKMLKLKRGDEVRVFSNDF